MSNFTVGNSVNSLSVASTVNRNRTQASAGCDAFASIQAQVATPQMVPGVSASDLQLRAQSALEPQAVAAADVGHLATNGDAQKFQSFSELSPSEKIRANVLTEMGISNGDYQKLSPSVRSEVDARIAARSS